MFVSLLQAVSNVNFAFPPGVIQPFVLAFGQFLPAPAVADADPNPQMIS
jgi:hypothetical protein